MALTKTSNNWQRTPGLNLLYSILLNEIGYIYNAFGTSKPLDKLKDYDTLSLKLLTDDYQYKTKVNQYLTKTVGNIVKPIFDENFIPFFGNFMVKPPFNENNFVSTRELLLLIGKIFILI